MSNIDVSASVPTNAAGYMEGHSHIDFTPINEYIGAALQEIYGFVNDSVFYTISDPAMRPFYRMVQNWEHWINGFVPCFHNVENGCVPTRFAKNIVEKVTSLIYGGGITLSVEGKKRDVTGENESLQTISEWVKATKFKDTLQSGIRQAVGLGTSALKVNVSGGCPWVDAVPFNRFLATLNARGEIDRIMFYLQPFISSINSREDGTAYHLMEERYYSFIDGERVPVIKYSVYMSSSLINQFDVRTGSLGWEQLPRFVRDGLRRDFSAFRIGEERRLPFNSLGVQLLRYTPQVTRMPWVKYGESVLDGVIGSLCDLDLLEAAKRTEMYVARPRVFAKKSIQNPNNTYNANSGIDSFLFSMYETTDMTDKGLHVLQPELRSDSFRAMRNAILEDIATSIGISPSSFAQYLQDASNRTAREVSAEESATALFVEIHRDTITGAINSILSDVCKYKGLLDTVCIRWSLAGQSNYTLLTDNVVKLRTAGLMSTETCVTSIHPDWSEEEVCAEIERIKQEEKERRDLESSMFGDNNDIEEAELMQDALVGTLEELDDESGAT